MLFSVTIASRTYAIAEAVAREAHAKAATYAEWAVRETGFGVAEHKKLKNELTSLPFLSSTGTGTSSDLIPMRRSALSRSRGRPE